MPTVTASGGALSIHVSLILFVGMLLYFADHHEDLRQMRYTSKQDVSRMPYIYRQQLHAV